MISSTLSVVNLATRDIAYYAIAAVLVVMVLIGISLMSKVERAAIGNRLGALSMLIMIVLTLWYFAILSVVELWIAMLVGAAIGIWLMRSVKMIQMPQMVGLLNGFGGAASMLAGILTLIQPSDESAFSLATAGLAIAVGSLTFFGSLIAAGKLHGVISGRSVKVPGHQAWIYLSLLASAALIVVLTVVEKTSISVGLHYLLIVLLAIVSGAFGVLFSIRVGGADMPITISLLNSFSGVAGSIAGMAIADPLLVAVGGVVGASGLLLTRIMCRAMNRSLTDILLGATSVAAKPQVKAEEKKEDDKEKIVDPELSLDPMEEARKRLADASSVIIVPGYGMALAQAQHLVSRISQDLLKKGTSVAFGIHPVAGRMPGHMNVLLAEADVPYDLMLDMDQANDKFKTTDLVIVIGANDVINPAAQTAEGTPIYGMPILQVEDAAHTLILNLDRRPGYAGVDNPLYAEEPTKVTCLFGDAMKTLEALLAPPKAIAQEETKDTLDTPISEAKRALKKAKSVVIVPGYGMALAQAQHLVWQLSQELMKAGAKVSFGIHPVAGRMPGHMNVLLAEADVPYDLMLEMDQVNDKFSETDVVIVIGANDVINPAAKVAEGTPIFGMPILEVDKAEKTLILNLDQRPGYAGVDNPLYEDKENVICLFGDATESLNALMKADAVLPETVEDVFDPYQTAADHLNQAKSVVIVPGYGMAIAQAQHLVHQLSDRLAKHGAKVTFGIHPVAGRMPGHMNVLLAEADVAYDLMLEMDQANELFPTTDAVLVIGANDVVNPAAQTAEGTPIYGMPILQVENAKHVIILNMDDKPGYAGVDNPLYAADEKKVTLLFGDAATTLGTLLSHIS